MYINVDGKVLTKTIASENDNIRVSRFSIFAFCLLNPLVSTGYNRQNIKKHTTEIDTKLTPLFCLYNK